MPRRHRHRVFLSPRNQEPNQLSLVFQIIFIYSLAASRMYIAYFDGTLTFYSIPYSQLPPPEAGTHYRTLHFILLKLPSLWFAIATSCGLRQPCTFILPLEAETESLESFNPEPGTRVIGTLRAWNRVPPSSLNPDPPESLTFLSHLSSMSYSCGLDLHTTEGTMQKKK